tara:strand:+ start:153 stop:728 length:576 start_codon:yes stop_codon:yes gene_type:complete
MFEYVIENIYQLLGVVFSIIYVILSIKQNIYCWPALIIAALLNMVAYNIINLPLQVTMQIFFIITAIYGWRKWRAKIDTTTKKELKITSWDTKTNIWYISCGLLITIILAVFLENYNLSDFPFLDSLMFSFNIIPMYMTGKKILQSWIYFIVIDIISGVFYLFIGEYFFAFLFFCYIGFASHGYITWKKEI